MVLFSVVFYVQNRFRTITLEPFYLIYAAYAATLLAERWRLFQRFPRLTEAVASRLRSK
jgi:hypothetical protein